jgi:multidrug efflux pump subunit AcrA (membrane-fusion protein)
VVKPDGNISFRQVRLGDPYGENIEVLAGLGEGEKIALDPIKAGIALKQKRAGGGS